MPPRLYEINDEEYIIAGSKTAAELFFERETSEKVVTITEVRAKDMLRLTMIEEDGSEIPMIRGFVETFQKHGWPIYLCGDN